jgi:hypothetical protein
MTYSVGNSEVANYANTSSGQVTNVAADEGLGGAGVVTNVVDRVALSFVVATNIQFLTVDVTSLAGYVAGITDVTITVNPNVYVYGSVPTQQYPTVTPPGFFANLSGLDASMQIIGGAEGDTIKLVNNGNIVGYGGDGGGVYEFRGGCSCCYSVEIKGPSKGNAALSFITPGISLAIENNGYIAGGGGGGGGSGLFFFSGSVPGGGGGAGGGISGVVGKPVGANSGTDTVRAVPPNAGNNGVSASVLFGCCNSLAASGGGGGGFVLPGTGGVYDLLFDQAGGGGAGGSGAFQTNTFPPPPNNNGGSANNNAPTPTLSDPTYQGGGGGGWGASGAAGYTSTTLYQVGAVGGNSIVTNGNAYTLTGSGTLYGSVDTALRSVVYTFPTSIYNAPQLDLSSISGYTNGTNVVLLVPASVVLTSDSSSSAGLTLFNTGDNPSSLRMVINGAILGKGGLGGSETSQGEGGDALYINTNSPTQVIVDNKNGYLAGGGGGGGRAFNNTTIGASTVVTYGGGGAGYFGSSGTVGNAAYNAGVSSGVSVGNNGTVVVGAVTYASGGSGGTILPGILTRHTGSYANQIVPGLGGSAGGVGAFSVTTNTVTFSNPQPGNYGGAYRENGGFLNMTGGTPPCAGGGGGGWGAQGGSGRRTSSVVQSGRAGGKAIRLLNSNTVIFVTDPTKVAGIIAFA